MLLRLEATRKQDGIRLFCTYFFRISHAFLYAWNTKYFNIGESVLTRINFANISLSTKFIDTLKYYQKCLVQLTKAVSDKEKNVFKKLTRQFLVRRNYFRPIWKQIAPEEKNKPLEIIAGGKDIIPDEKIVLQYSLDLVPENGDFFQKSGFFSELKQKFVSDDKYENSNYLYKTLRMRNLNNMNDLYNTQDVILLCEIIENCFQLMYDKYGFNQRKCNSASTLSSCIKQDLSKVIIALPTSNEVFEVFKRTLSGGFSCVNNRLSFDTEILLLNADKMVVDNNNKNNWKDYGYKLRYKLKLYNEERYSNKRVIYKILKLVENNQYRFAMTKPLPTGCIKKEQMPTWGKFNLLLEAVDLDDPIGHLLVADIYFDHKRASVKQILYNKIFPPVIEKHKIINPSERSVCQLLE